MQEGLEGITGDRFTEKDLEKITAICPEIVACEWRHKSAKDSVASNDFELMVIINDSWGDGNEKMTTDEKLTRFRLGYHSN